MSTANQRLRLGRVIGYGILAEVATIAVIMLTVTVYSRFIAAGVPDDFAQRVPAVLGPLGGIVFTLIAAMLASRSLTDRIRLHGALVGVITAALTVPMIFQGSPSDRPLYLAAITLKIVAGVMGGALSERRQVRSVPA